MSCSTGENQLNIEPDGKINLSGKWYAECAEEYANMSTINCCELCPFVIDQVDKSKGQIKDIEFTFTPDIITIKRPDGITTLPYSMDADTHTFQILFKEHNLTFRVFYNKHNIILEDQDGYIVTLRRA